MRRGRQGRCYDIQRVLVLNHKRLRDGIPVSDRRLPQRSRMMLSPEVCMVEEQIGHLINVLKTYFVSKVFSVEPFGTGIHVLY